MKIVRKEEYSVGEAAFLLGLTATTVIAICDSGLMRAARVVASGPKAQRKRRFIAHDELVRFNNTRFSDARADIGSRLQDADSSQGYLAFAQPEASIPIGDDSVWLTKQEWATAYGAIYAFSRSMKSPSLDSVLAKVGPSGSNVSIRGLQVIELERPGV